MQHFVVDLSNVASDRSLASDARLKRRLDAELQVALAKLFESRGVTDLTQHGSVTVKIKLGEPTFAYDRETGSPTHIIPGNPKFSVGDHIKKPRKGEGAGTGNGAGAGVGQTEDGFVFEASSEELERRLFEDLHLPDMAQKQLVRISETTVERAGFRPDGPAASLDLVRSSVRAVGRRKAFNRPSLRAIEAAEAEIDELREGEQTTKTVAAIAALERNLERMRARRRVTPFMDKSDLRYRRTQLVEIPISQAVIFNIMDVSGSMTEHHKNLAKQFFWLLRRLITLNYKEVDIVWIKHTDVAQEVTEKDFFFSRESGGTVVSSALERMLEIVKDRYPLHLWNIYVCQATDGDTWMNYKKEDDALTSALIIQTHILPIVQYYAYLECWDEVPGGRKGSAVTTNLWLAYEQMNRPNKFQMKRVHSPDQIYPVFANLFRDKGVRKVRAA